MVGCRSEPHRVGCRAQCLIVSRFAHPVRLIVVFFRNIAAFPAFFSFPFQRLLAFHFRPVLPTFPWRQGFGRFYRSAMGFPQHTFGEQSGR